LNELGTNKHVKPGDYYKQSNPDKTVDLGDTSLLQANPDELESPETLVDNETIEVDINSTADKEIEDEEDVADTKLRRSSCTHRPNTQYTAYTATKGIIILKTYKATVSD
jgi:hypothetical protein